MPAFSSVYPWPPHGNFRYFERRMEDHQKVISVSERGGGVYELTLSGGAKFKAFICECYSFGEAEYVETMDKLGSLNAIIINSAWCNYTTEAKMAARDAKVGMFTIGELMGALHQQEPWSYLTAEQRERYKKAGLI